MAAPEPNLAIDARFLGGDRAIHPFHQCPRQKRKSFPATFAVFGDIWGKTKYFQSTAIIGSEVCLPITKGRGRL